MKKLTCLSNLLLISLVLLPSLANAELTNGKQSKYIGEESRPIKSLSSKDVEALQSGAGWGLAKPAELNGIPGPIHLLELQQDLGLSNEQTNSIQAIWSSMNKQAKAEGKKYLAAEENIENFFRLEKKHGTELENLLKQSATHLAMLRKIHLSAHLEVLPLLSTHQIKKYNLLRGYQDHSNHSH